MFNFENFDEEQLLNCTYQQALEILEQMEEDSISVLNGTDDIDKLANYIFIANYLRDSAKDKLFSDLDYRREETMSKLGFLMSRLVSIIVNCEFYIKLNDSSVKAQTEINATLELLETLSDKISESDVDSRVNDIKQKTEAFSSKIDEFKKDLVLNKKELNKEKTLTQKALAKYKQQMDNMEHSMLAHVLTLLGVFSAIIVTIMSMVITASSWLNSASGEGKLLACVVPIGIVIVAIVVMLTLIYPLYTPMNTESNKKKKIAIGVFFISELIVVIGIIGLIAWLSYLQSKEGKIVHVKYVIEEQDYSVVENEDEGKLYSVTIDGKTKEFSYDEKLLHDKKLHFCELHNALE